MSHFLPWCTPLVHQFFTFCCLFMPYCLCLVILWALCPVCFGLRARQRKTHWHHQLLRQTDKWNAEQEWRIGQLNGQRTRCPNWSLFPCYSIFSQQLTPNTDVRNGTERGWGPPRSSLFLTMTRALTVNRVVCFCVSFEEGKETQRKPTKEGVGSKLRLAGGADGWEPVDRNAALLSYFVNHPQLVLILRIRVRQHFFFFFC